jgi:hypothetical protein
VGPHVGSNPAKRREKIPVTEPEKVAPGILSDFEIPDTAINRARIGHGAKRTKDCRIVLEKRLVPQTSKRRIK